MIGFILCLFRVELYVFLKQIYSLSFHQCLDPPFPIVIDLILTHYNTKLNLDFTVA